jgi:dolichol-phosphate mannosyltransferase
MQISVIIPTYNEEENIEAFYGRVAPILESLPYDWEMIFINDGSRDRSAELIQALHERDTRVRLLNLSRNFGSYGAISAGFMYAHGDAIIAISCDLQDPPELIRDFVQKWEEGADIVWGVRASREDPGLKSLYANSFYWFLRRFVWPDFPPGGMDFGLFDRRVIDLYNQLPVRNTIPFLTIYDMGFRQERLPYHRQARLRGVSGWSFLRRLKAAIDVMIDFSYTPIRFITGLGFVVSFLSLLYAAFVIFNRLVFGIGGSGWPSLVVLLTLFGGIQLVVLGTLGEYIWRVAEQVRERPRFLIMDRVGFEKTENPGRGQERYQAHAHLPLERK